MTRRPANDGGERSSIVDVIGFWSEVKLEIVRKYLPAYTTVLTRQKPLFKTLYVDAFAGSGHHISKTTGELVMGSPAIALDTKPPFDEYHFIDLDQAKVEVLEALAQERNNVFVYHGDCNAILHQRVFTRAKYEDYRRALCFLDPYNLQLNWDVVAAAGQMRTVELFLNFPMLAIHRNVLRHDPKTVTKRNMNRMTQFWGNDSWREVGYREALTLFGPTEEKIEGRELAELYRERLRTVAGFSYVPQPMAMRNSQGGVVYYLFFCSYNRTGGKIVADIFERFRTKGYR